MDGNGMAEFFESWRWRLSIHAMLILLLGALAGVLYFGTLTRDDPPCPPSGVKRHCVIQPSMTAQCDDPCLTDTVVESRWSSAHRQALLHGLLLLGVALAAPYLRLGHLVVTVAGWLLILGCWGAPLAAFLQAVLAESSQGPLAYCPTTQGQAPAYECVALTVGAFAGPATGLALFVVAWRSLWEVLRDAIAPPTWRNWSWTVKTRARRIVSPRNPDELVEAVQDALNGRLCVRAFGGRYSWNAIAPTEDVMIDMRQLREIGAIGPPPAQPVAANTNHVVTVQAGATIREVSEFLARQSPPLMLATTPVNPWIQVGGALALGCHGTGVELPPFFELVTAIDIVQYHPGPNRLAALNAAHGNLTYERPPLPWTAANAAEWREWNALLVSLGSLGVLCRVTFECEPLYTVYIEDKPHPMHATIGDGAALANIVNGNQFAEIFWYPFNENCFVRAWNQAVPTVGAKVGFPWWFWIRQWAVAVLGDVVLFFALLLLPFLTPWLSRRFNDWFAHLNHFVPAPDAMQYERYFPHVYDMGYAIPIDPGKANGFAAFQNAWFGAVARIETARARGEYPQNLPIHARFGRASEALLAPNAAGAAPAYAFIEVMTHVHTGRHEPHFHDVEQVWHRLGGNSHWGKVTSDRTRLAANYPIVAIQQFRAVRANMDPDGVFLNDFVRDALGVP